LVVVGILSTVFAGLRRRRRRFDMVDDTKKQEL